MKKLLISISILLTQGILAQSPKALKHHDATLDALFGHYDNGEQPGVAIAIIENDRPIFLKSYGHANLEYQIKNTPNSLFNAADLAKQFTVFSILLLQDQGEISMHDDVKKYLPLAREWPFEITLKQLMEQTSGLRDVMELKKWSGYQNGDVITKQDILDIVAKQRYLNFPSGSKFEYNRTGFVLLAEVVAKVSGIPFSAFVRQHIFEPLEMNNSLFVDSHNELVPNRSYSYTTADNELAKIANNSSFMGGTNLYTSVSDFAKWLQNMGNPTIGKPWFYEYLHTRIQLLNGQKSNYTPGIYRDNSEGYSRIHLEGFDHGYTAYMMYLPEHAISLVFFSNDLDFPIDEVYEPIFDWINTDYGVPAVQPTTEKVERVKFITKPATELRQYTGNYLFEDTYSSRKVVLENDTLFYSRSEANRTPMVPIEGDHRFKMLFPGNDNIRVTFKKEMDVLEFREINVGVGADFIMHGKKFTIRTDVPTAFLGEYKSEELGHTISIQNTNGELQLMMNDRVMVLDQIGDNSFLPHPNPKVHYLKLQRDKQLAVVGVYVSGGQIKNLYYNLLRK